jgi:hypothetical protein
MWADKYIEKLKEGEAVQFRPRGNSMTPKIKNGQLVTVKPIERFWGVGHPKVGDIVLCKVAGAQYLHLVSAISEDEQKVQISNNKGHINGWTSARNIFGLVTDVEP